MKDTTIIRVAEIIAGVVIIVTHAYTGMNSLLILLGALLLGVPIEIFLERKRKKEEGGPS